MLGNWKNLPEEQCRLSHRTTMNKGFFSCLAFIVQVLPYIYSKYHNNGKYINFCYYSHNYGSYPNFNVFGKYIILNYEPNTLADEELICLHKLCRTICGGEELNSDLCSFKNNFELANKYFNLFFKFDDEIIQEKNNIKNLFNNKKTLGIQLRGTDKLKVDFSQNIPLEDIIKIINIELNKNDYSNIFIASDTKDYIDCIKENFSNKYNIINIQMDRNNENQGGLHFNNFEEIKNLLDILKKTEKNNIKKKIELELELEQKCKINELLLKNTILDSLLLSECDLVLETQSQVAGFSKVFNPNLKIYRLNSLKYNYWPDSFIDLYEIEDKYNFNIKKYQNLEFSKEIKFNFQNMQDL